MVGRRIGRRRLLVVGLVAAALVATTAGLANADGSESITADTWIASGNVKGQLRYNLTVNHYSVCVTAMLGYKNASTGGQWVYSGNSQTNCNDNHNVRTAQSTVTATDMCPGTGDTDWQVRGYGEAFRTDGLQVHREPDTNWKWGDVVTRQC